MKIRVGKITYLNSEPFYYKLVRDDIELVNFVPSALGKAAEQGEIDAGPLPLVDFFRLQDRFKQLAQFCICTVDKSRSVLMFAKKPIQDLEGATIGVTDQSSTARRLLQVLLNFKYEVKPAAYVALTEPNDAQLIIGDDALRRRYGIPSYPYRYDLGEEWYSWTRMPFVYAVWAIRKDFDPKRENYLENVLYSCIDEGLEHLYVIGEQRPDVMMGPRDLIEYFQGLRYWVGVSERKAIDHFKGLLDALPAEGTA